MPTRNKKRQTSFLNITDELEAFHEFFELLGSLFFHVRGNMVWINYYSKPTSGMNKQIHHETKQLMYLEKNRN